MQQSPHSVEDAGFLNGFTTRLLPLVIDGLNSVLRPKETSPVAKNDTMQGQRQAPPPPPHAHLPEDFRDMRGQGMQNGSSFQQSSPVRREQQLLEDRKMEMQQELDDSLKQLDGERKEGLYRLDWELAEAIEALHEKHADRANKMINQHRETVSMMEKRAQAGEEMTPDKVQMLRSPMREAPVQSAPVSLRRQDTVEQESEEESECSSEESESEEEGMFDRFMNGRFMNMLRGDSQQPQARRGPWARQHSQEFSPRQLPALSPTDHWPGEGFYGSPEGTNGYDMNAPSSSPMALISGMPDLPFANGHSTFDMQMPFAGGETVGLSPVPNAAFEPTEWSPSPGFRGSLGPLPGSPQWPPTNIYHGGGY